MRIVNVFNTHRKRRARREPTRDVVRLVLSGEGCRTAAINVVFINTHNMRRLNGRYLGHWYDTDVLSFPLSDEDSPGIEGEVYVNLDQAWKQSVLYKEPPRAAIARLVIHGVLHLLGEDDQTKRQKARMRNLENRYLQKSGHA